MESLDLDRVYRPHCVRFVLTTSVKILPYRPPGRLTRANYSSQPSVSQLESRDVMIGYSKTVVGGI